MGVDCVLAAVRCVSGAVSRVLRSIRCMSGACWSSVLLGTCWVRALLLAACRALSSA